MILAYVRTSTARQADPNKASIDEQVAKCRQVASFRGSVGKYDFQTYVDRGVSGSKPLDQRPAGKDLLAAAKRGDTIIVSKMDRIFRSASDSLKMIEYFKGERINLIICDMGIEPVADSPVSTLFFSMLASFAQFERSRICERIMEGKGATRARRGHMGGGVPFGFRKHGVGATSRLVFNADEWQHASVAVELRAAGLSYEQIARRMMKRGMLSRNARCYSKMQIHRMVSSRAKQEAEFDGQSAAGGNVL